MTIEEKACSTRLTKNEKKVLEYILQNLERTCYMTSNEIAKELKVGDTSVIRMAKSLGFSGYGEFKKKLVLETLEKKYQKINNHLPFEKISITDSIDLEQIPELVFQNIQNNILKDQNRNEIKKYIEIAHKIMGAKKKYIAGFRNTYGIANYFSTVLSHVIPEVTHLNGYEGFEDQAIDMDENDVLILFTLPRYSQNALQVHKIAKERKCPVIVITNQLTSSVTEGAAYVLVHSVDSLNFANSIVGVTLTVEILVTLISKLAGEKGKKRLEKLDEYMSETGMY